MSSNSPALNLQKSQQALVQAIRMGENAEHFAPQALAIYARLVRNNCLSFIDRCYTETPAHCAQIYGAEKWTEIKELFVQQGKAHSPYFQDIALEFLNFCRKAEYFCEPILALMDFEQTQLQAEVAQGQVPSAQPWQAESNMQLSPTAFLREYEVDFLSCHFQQILPQKSQLLVWRDSLFDVYQQQLSDLDFWLLNYVAEQPCSLQHLQQALTQILAPNPEIQPLLQQAWQRWIQAEVLIPAIDLSN